MILKEQVRAFEERVDRSFTSLPPPVARSWEKTALYLLHAHATLSTAAMMAARSPSMELLPTGDQRLYALMHAFLWCDALPSEPVRGFSPTARAGSADRAADLLHRGAQYDSVFTAFSNWSRGRFSVVDLRDEQISFAAPYGDLELFALDHETSDRSRGFRPSRQFVAAMSNLMDTWLDTSPVRHGYLDLGGAVESLRQLMVAVRSMTRWNYILPSSWHYRDYSLEQLRKFWDALTLLAMTHSMASARLTLALGPGLHSVLWGPRSQVLAWIATLSGLRLNACDELVRLMTYDRTRWPRDIAHSPFVLLGSEILGASPDVLQVSRLERNFYALLKQIDRPWIDNNSHVLAQSMASELSAGFRRAGYRTATGVSVSTSDGRSSDIDLLVWSPTENAILAAELKWFVAPGDFKESDANEKRAEASLGKQLPVYAAALDEDCSGVMRRAFGPHIAVKGEITVSAGLIMRGDVGGARLMGKRHWFVGDAVLQSELKRSKRLRPLLERLEHFQWMAETAEGLSPTSNLVVSPSGLRIWIPGHAREISTDGNDRYDAL